MKNDKLINHVLEDVKKIEKVNTVFLFGSYAKGTHKPYSDIDICVLPSSQLTKDERTEILSNGTDKIDISIFQDLPLLIQHRIIKEGKILLNRDKLILHRAKVKSIKEYLDFKHILDRHVERVLGG